MTPTATGARHLLDFRPALRNRAAMGFTLGYVGHSYELMAVRGWLVVFLAFAESLQPEAMRGWNLTLIASLAVLAGMPSSILGGELALRYGRKRLVSWVMAATVLAALAAGVSASLPFPVVIALVVIYNVMIMGDSAALTAGALGGARPGEQGATLAVHSLAGFSASFVGPLAVGVTLDLAGGNTSATAWIWAFAAMGAGSALGLVLLRWIAVEAEKN
jgi:MFS family permease